MKLSLVHLFSLIVAVPLSACSGEGETMNIREQVTTVEIEIDNEGEKPSVLYTANISSETMFCAGVVNGMEQLGNLSTSSGTFSSGFNATAFLQQGKNHLDVWAVPVGLYQENYDYNENDQCQVTLYGAFEDGTKEEMSSLAVTIEDGKPTVKTSRTYPANHQTPLDRVDGVTDGNLTEFRRPIYIKTIPRWRWVDATPFNENNPEHMKKLYRAYTNLIQLMEKRDFEGLKMAWSLSNREKAKAEAYYSTPDEFFDALGFESTFKRFGDGEVRPRREWHEYTLESFMDGRLVRLKDKRDHSPLRIGSDKQKVGTTFTPYFSLIDGRVVVSR
ncbi:glycosyl hydrolase family 26 [Vibrio brasiliensis]|nr:glycosyl hydrolase family 26 [Vibrio brasiliensis]MCG9753191.1 glycosyl hydrolase family 26 [Vibrio brasiliensis]